jgi:MFS family permease
VVQATTTATATPTEDNAEARNGRQSLGQILSAFRNPNYRLYWFGFMTSILGLQVQTVAQGYLVFERTGSALNLGFVSGAQAASALVFSLVGGVIADRVERRKLLMATQTGEFACSFALGTLALTGVVEVWHIAAIACIFGAFQAFDQPARSSLIPQLIPREDLMNAYALNSTVWQTSGILGPAIAGLLLGIAGAEACFYVTAAGFLVFVLALARIHVRVEQSQHWQGFKSLTTDFVEGIGYIRRRSLFVALMGMSFFNAVFGLSFYVLMPVFALDTLDAGKAGMSALYASVGIGALIGAFVVAGLGDYPRKGLLIIGGMCLFGVLLVVFSMSRWLPLSMAILVATGIARNLYMTSAQTVLQIRVEDAFRGRLNGVYALTWSLAPLGGLLAGAVADAFGAPFAVGMGGALVALFALYVGIRQPELRRPLEPVPDEPAVVTARV